MANGNGYTPTQRRLLEIFGDGLPHHRTELAPAFDDELVGEYAVRMALTRLRAKLRQIGEDILVEFIRGRPHYRQVRLLSEGLPLAPTADD